MEAKHKPVQEFRTGAIKAVIWTNSGKNGTFYSVSVGRLYKDGNTWKIGQSVGQDDLPTLCSLIERARAWILEQRRAA